MSIVSNKALVARYAELYRTGDLAIADAIIGPDFVDHAHPELPRGPAGVKAMVAQYRTAFPDAVLVSEQVIAEGDRVSWHFVVSGAQRGALGTLPATGKTITLTGVDIMRIAEGKLVELWSMQDTLGMLRQMGFQLTPPASA